MFFLLSLVIHFVFFYFLLGERITAPPPKRKEETKVDIKISSKESKKSSRNEGRPIESPSSNSEHSCEEESSYYGIGVVLRETNLLCIVEKVAKNSPAARAEIKEGYLVYEKDSLECPKRGKEGTKITLLVFEDKNLPPKTITLQRAKICLEN